MPPFIHGCDRDTEDKRDYRLAKAFARVAPLPAAIDYTGIMGLVRNQGGRGACVGFACGALKTSDEMQEDKTLLDFSPLFVYWQRTNAGSGMYPREAMQVLQDKGCCLEKSLPYDSNIGDNGQIPDFTFKEAVNYKIMSYARVYTVDELRQSLVEFGPTFFSVPVYTGFNSGGSTGIVPLPNPATDQLLGGHALICVGYDDNTKLFKFKNSWGKEWGDNGYGYLPYEFVEKFIWDIWQTVDAPSDVFKENKFWWARLWDLIPTAIKTNPPLAAFIAISGILIVLWVLGLIK